MTGVIRIAGYASIFHVRDGAGDRVASGAFRSTLAHRPPHRVAMLWQHDPARPIGRWTRICETKRGLWVEGELARGVAAAQEAASLIAFGALNGLSIGFKAQKASRGRDTSGRILREIDLWEISLVTFPQAEGARVRTVLPARDL